MRNDYPFYWKNGAWNFNDGLSDARDMMDVSST